MFLQVVPCDHSTYPSHWIDVTAYKPYSWPTSRKSLADLKQSLLPKPIRYWSFINRSYWFAERFFRWLLYLKTLEQTQAGLWAPRCHNGRSHVFLECLGVRAIVWHAVCSRQPRWNRDPFGQRPLGRRRFFIWFCADFCVILELLFSKRQVSKHTILVRVLDIQSDDLRTKMAIINFCNCFNQWSW